MEKERNYWEHTVIDFCNRCFFVIFVFSQLMEMARGVWSSSPNVITHLEKEAEKHRLDDERRKEKVRQLKVHAIYVTLRVLFYSHFAL